MFFSRFGFFLMLCSFRITCTSQVILHCEDRKQMASNCMGLEKQKLDLNKTGTTRLCWSSVQITCNLKILRLFFLRILCFSPFLRFCNFTLFSRNDYLGRWWLSCGQDQCRYDLVGWWNFGWGSSFAAKRHWCWPQWHHLYKQQIKRT